MNIFQTKIKNIILFLFLILFSPYPAIIKGENKSVEIFPQNVEYGDAKNAHYLFKTGQYALALGEYLKLPDKYFLEAEINYKVGICYLQSFPKEQALRYLTRAWKIDSTMFDDHAYYLGYALHVNYAFTDAINFYNKFLDSRPDILETEKTKKRIEECKSGIRLVNDTLNVVVKNMYDINSPAPEYRPLPYNDKTLYFTSRKKSLLYEVPDHDNFFHEKIFSAGITGKGSALEPSVENEAMEHTSLLHLSPGNLAVVYSSKKGDGDIILAKYKDGRYSETDLLKNINTRYNETSGILTKNGDTLYFVSDRRDMSMGGKDIFFSVKSEDGTWNKPVNAGKNINTVYDEEGVNISPRGDVLYFSSKGHNTMGGYDVFKVEMLPDGSWDTPQNMGFPLNTPLDEVFFYYTENDEAYFASNREGSLGDLDIFYASNITPEPETITPIPVEIITLTPDTIQPDKQEKINQSKGQLTDISIEITDEDPGNPDNIDVKLEENKELRIFLPLNEKGEVDVVIEDFEINNHN